MEEEQDRQGCSNCAEISGGGDRQQIKDLAESITWASKSKNRNTLMTQSLRTTTIPSMTMWPQQRCSHSINLQPDQIPQMYQLNRIPRSLPFRTCRHLHIAFANGRSLHRRHSLFYLFVVFRPPTTYIVILGVAKDPLIRFPGVAKDTFLCNFRGVGSHEDDRRRQS